MSFTTVEATVMDTVVVDKTHRKHAIIEQVSADMKNSALVHLPSGHCGANSAWLAITVMSYNLTRTSGVLAAGKFGRSRTATIRAKLVNIPTRIGRQMSGEDNPQPTFDADLEAMRRVQRVSFPSPPVTGSSPTNAPVAQPCTTQQQRGRESEGIGYWYDVE